MIVLTRKGKSGVKGSKSPLFILSGILGLGALAVALRYRRDIRAAHKRIEDLGSQVALTDCGPVEYLRRGQGYPVLVVHGAMGGFDQGLIPARNLGLPNLQIISVSRFGHLRSPVPPGANLDLQADAFASLLDALAIRQAAVLAVSAGATSAIRLAARHPERVSALILLGPDAPGKTSMALPPRWVFDTLMRSDFLYWALLTLFGKEMQTAFGLVPKGYVLTPESAALVNHVQAINLPTSRRMDGWMFETYTCAEEFFTSVTPVSPYPLRRIQTPTLVINAADDTLSIPDNVRRLADQLPNARRFMVPDGGHLFLGHAEEVRAAIAGFLLNSVTDLRALP